MATVEPRAEVDSYRVGTRSESGPSQRGTSRRKPLRRRWTPAFLLAPAAIVMIAVVGYPLGRMVVNSFQEYGPRQLFGAKPSFVWFDNYIAAFQDPDFWPVVIRSVLFTAALLAGTLIIGMALAQLMTKTGKTLRTIMGIILIAAWAVPTVASTIVWEWLFEPLYGVSNWLLTQLGIFGDLSTHSWIESSVQAFFIVWLLIVWQAVPFVALTLYSGQSQISKDFYEAARLDGATEWQIYKTVTLPFLRGILALVAILSVIWDFNVFNQIWILTQGGPNGGTTTIGIWTYEKAFASNSYGVASAIAIVTVIFLMIMTAGYVRSLVRTGEKL